MALNSFATQSLRSTPGYVPYKPPALPAFTLPPLAQVPVPPMPPGDFGQAGRPNASAEAYAQGQLGVLPTTYNPQRSLAKERAAAALTPLGGYEFQKDDPSTPQDESLNLVATGKEGQAHRDAYRSVRGAQAARGALYSSFTDSAMGDAYTRISEAQRGIVNQYADQLSQINQNQNQAANQITDNLVSLYGSDAQWLRDNPPPPPPPAAAAPAATLGATGSSKENPTGTIRPAAKAAILSWPQWAAYQQKAKRPAAQINPANFWAYVVAHGGTKP